MVHIGEELKRERELRGISLEEISNITKINIRFLEALEEDRFDALPGKFFFKGIARAYAKSVGLDEDYVLNKYYEASFFQDQPQVTEHKKAKTEPIISKSLRKKIDSILLIIFVLIFLVFLYFILQKKESTPPPEQPQSSLSQKKDIILPPLPESHISEVEAKELHIDITFVEETWIQVYADGKLRINGLKFPGENERVKALKEIRIHLGNAGGISYSLNNKRGKRLGSSGVVLKNIRITLENYQEYLIQSKEDIIDN